MADTILHRLALFAERRYRTVFLVAAILAIGAIAAITRIRFDPDVLALLPQDDPVVQTFQETLSEFGALDLLLIVVRVPEGAVLDPYQDFAGQLGARLAEHPDMEWVEWGIGRPSDLAETFLPRAFFLLPPERRAGVLERLSDEGIRERVPEIRRLITTPRGIVQKELLRLDPLGLAEVFLEQLDEGRGAVGVDWASGYYLSRDRRMLLLLAKPVRPAQDVEFTRGLVASIEDVVGPLREQWSELAGPQAGPAPEVDLGGSYITAVSDEQLIRRDVIVNAVTSMGVVLVLFFFTFRRLGLLIYAFLPLTFGLLLTFGGAGLFVGKLSSATSGMAALLVGLGIDFVIVSYGRFVEERRAGKDSSEALRQMTGSCGRAVVAGGVTSAATFGAFTVTEFSGLRQMGVVTGIGILLCMMSVLILLPAVLAWREARHARRDTSPPVIAHGFGAGHLVAAAMDRPRLALGLGGVVTLVFLALLPRLEYEDRIQNMRPEGNPGIQVQEEVAESFGSNFKYMMLVLEAPTSDEVLELAGTATEAVRPLVADGILSRVDSIGTVIPAPHRQEEVLAWLADSRAKALDPARIETTFREALAENGLRAGPFEKGLALLQEAIGVDAEIDMREVRETSAARLLDRYLKETDEGWKSVVYLYTWADEWKREPPPELERIADELGPSAVLTGVNVVSRNLRTIVRRDAVIAAVLGSLLVVLLLWADFRRLGEALVALVPLVIGLVWMLGIMSLLGLKINFMNIFVTTMIIGIGVDYGIHMIHRFREVGSEDPAALRVALSETGRAIALAAVTTSVGFGSLGLSHYPGLRSIGFVAILGAVSTALVAVTLLPAWVAWRTGDRSTIEKGER